MVNHQKALLIEVLPSTRASILTASIREGWRVGDFYIIASDVCGKERFFVAETVKFDCFGVTAQIISRPFVTFKSARKIALSSARALAREMKETGPLAPSAMREMLRSLVTHQTITTRTGNRFAR